jgi:predicted phage tail protein
MRNRIFGLIGVLWGGAMLVSAFLRGGAQGSGAYAAGQTGALIFAVVLVIAGAYYLLKGSGKERQAPRQAQRQAPPGKR